MATNGQSARKWLEENQNNAPKERVEQIRKSIAEKLAKLDDSDDSSLGLLEALDVLDQHIHSSTDAETLPSEDALKLDTGPLVSEASIEVPELTPEEKQARFQQLLKSRQLK